MRRDGGGARQAQDTFCERLMGGAKGESIDDCLARIARQELGIEVDLANKAMLGQYVGRFAT